MGEGSFRYRDPANAPAAISKRLLAYFIADFPIKAADR